MTRSVLPRRSPRPLSASRLLEPPSLDDLDYLPDPLGDRFGLGGYGERSEVADASGWEETQAGWLRRGD